jgi:hypothetical protein
VKKPFGNSNINICTASLSRNVGLCVRNATAICRENGDSCIGWYVTHYTRIREFIKVNNLFKRLTISVNRQYVPHLPLNNTVKKIWVLLFVWEQWHTIRQSYDRDAALQKSVSDGYCSSAYCFEYWYTHSDEINFTSEKRKFWSKVCRVLPVKPSYQNSFFLVIASLNL